MKFLPFLVTIPLVLFTTSHASEQGLTVEVPPGKYQCFFQPVQEDRFKTMEVDFQVGDNNFGGVDPGRVVLDVKPKVSKFYR